MNTSPQSHWLRTVTAAQRQAHSMLALGWLACIGLILYVTVLGEVGDLWRMQRKIGTILFFFIYILSAATALFDAGPAVPRTS